jgi:FAD/FMN-containing dehydrogenase
MSICGWGRYPCVQSTIHEFNCDQELRQIIANNNPLIAFGNGRSYGDSALGEHVIKLNKHDYFLSFDEHSGLLDVQAGVLLGDIVESFVPKGWFLSVTPGTKYVSVGGAIASDVHGKNHHVVGCFSQFVKQFTIMLASGEKVTCSSTQRPELFKATCGGMGLTGVIVDAQIYLQKINSRFIEQTTIKTANLQQTFEAFEQYSNHPYSVAWIDCLVKGDDIGKSLLMVGDFANDGQLDYTPKSKHNIPFDFPSFALNRFSVSGFNLLYYGKIRQPISHQKVDIDSFFYPLDALGHWHRIYGKKGFIQYQFILPKPQAYQGLQAILQTIAASGKGSFLAVLKLYGPANDNYLSFPLEGYSLALDFKVEEGLLALLNHLDEIVVNHQGRIYLTKDARVNAQVFEKGYPQIETFRQFRREHAMMQKFQSLQSTRVKI